MKIFISSLIGGFGEYRAATLAAIKSLGQKAIMAEDFSAGVSSPRVACLDGVRQSDLVILLLGADYGAVQQVSGLSATHEEYREAKDRRPVIAFVQDGVQRDPAQAAFVTEVQDWQGGLFRGGFTGADGLRDAVTQAIHNFQLSSATAAVDAHEMLARANELVPREGRSQMRGMSGPILHLVVVGGPAQTILRPVEIERPELAHSLMREATYGPHSIFDPAYGSKQAMADGKLELTQETGAAIMLDERGSVRLSVPVAKGGGMMGALIEENLIAALERGLAHAAEILAAIDSTQKLARLVIMAALETGGMMGWRTRREDEASPNSMTMSMGFDRGEKAPVHFQPPDRARAALVFERERMVEDFVTLLRRQYR